MGRDSLSPTLCLAYIAIVLKEADLSISKLRDAMFPRTSLSLRRPTPLLHRPSISVGLFSYTDDTNPLVIDERTTSRQHRDITNRITEILEETANKHHLSWDPAKDSSVTFGRGHSDSTISLGIHINSNFSFKQHINSRIEKGTRLSQVMSRLGNSHRGL